MVGLNLSHWFLSMSTQSYYSVTKMDGHDLDTVSVIVDMDE